MEWVITINDSLENMEKNGAVLYRFMVDAWYDGFVRVSRPVLIRFFQGGSSDTF